MTRARWLALAGLVAALAALALVYDALVVTDEERLAQLAEDVAGPVTAARITAARDRWVELDRQPLEVGALGRVALYRAGDGEALARRIRSAARTLSGSRVRVLTSGVEVEGDRASVTMQILDDRTGMAHLDFELERRGDDWLLARIAVRR